jgi:hypothetical protein
MAKPPAPPIKTPLVAKARAIITAIALQVTELKKIEKEIVDLGAGRYCDETNEAIGCTVVGATADTTGFVSYALPETAESEQIARKLAGEEFSKLFDRRVSYSPCEGFELLAPKLLTPARSGKLVNFCLVAGKVSPGKSAYIRWGKEVAAK